jgi:hypothetical protein
MPLIDHPLDPLYDKILDTLETGQLAEEDYWGAIYGSNFVELNALFKMACNDLTHNLKVNKGYYLEFENEGFEDSRNFNIDLMDQDGYFSTFSTLNIPVWDLFFKRQACFI